VPARRDDPYLNFNFRVELGGDEVAGFSEVVLPEGRIDVIEYREGSDKTLAARKLPGLVHYSNVVLKRGITGDTSLYDWWDSVRDGGGTLRRDVAITLHDEQQNAVQRWLLRDAFPVRLAYGALDGLGNEVAIETLELAYERFEVD
jgi:phage tail-like protein